MRRSVARRLLAALACVLTHGYCSGLALSLAVRYPLLSGSLCVLCFCHVHCLSPEWGSARARAHSSGLCGARGIADGVQQLRTSRMHCAGAAVQICPQLCTLPSELQRARACCETSVVISVARISRHGLSQPPHGLAARDFLPSDDKVTQRRLLSCALYPSSV